MGGTALQPCGLEVNKFASLAVAGKALQMLYLIDADGGGCGDVFGGEIGDVIERAGVVIIARRAKASGKFYAVAVMQGAGKSFGIKGVDSEARRKFFVCNIGVHAFRDNIESLPEGTAGG